MRFRRGARGLASLLEIPYGKLLLTAETINPDGARAKANGRIEMVEVEVPGAGLP